MRAIRMRSFLIIWCVLALDSVSPLHAQNPGDEVVVIYNTRVPESKDVAEHYAELRRVPSAQVLGFDLTANETMSRADYRARLQAPLIKALESKTLLHFGETTQSTDSGSPTAAAAQPKIRYLVLCYGVPLRIAEDSSLREDGEENLPPEFRRNEAAVDSELACLPIPPDEMLLAGPRTNPFYGCTNAALFNPTNDILLVARLDGPTASIARGLVDKAIHAETDGLWGRAYFDLRGLTNGEYKLGDDWMRGASEICRRVGLETVVDATNTTFPAYFPLSQVAFYAGWYDVNASGPFTRPTVEFMPGAFAYHLHSFSAFTLRSTSRGWVGPLLAKGATATMGCVAEPYLEGTPNMEIFFSRLISCGFSFGEAAYAAQPFLSWQVTVVGDPLYRPFGKGPRQLHDELERRHSKLIEWSYLRLANFKLLGGAPSADVINTLENLPATHESAVLTEKLADLHFQQGDAAASIADLQDALKLGPSPQQRIRITLALAGRLAASQRDQESYDVYRQFLKDVPDYPDDLDVYRRLRELAQKLGKKTDADRYAHEVSRLTAPPGSPHKGPFIRRGI